MRAENLAAAKRHPVGAPILRAAQEQAALSYRRAYRSRDVRVECHWQCPHRRLLLRDLSGEPEEVGVRVRIDELAAARWTITEVAASGIDLRAHHGRPFRHADPVRESTVRHSLANRCFIMSFNAVRRRGGGRVSWELRMGLAPTSGFVATGPCRLEVRHSMRYRLVVVARASWRRPPTVAGQ